MKFKITPKAVVLSVKYWLYIIASWAPPLNATRKDLILYDIAWCVALCGPGHVIPASMLSLSRGSLDPADVTKHVAESMAMVAVIIKMIVSRYHRSRLQVLCADLENFLETASEREKAIMDRYVMRCGRYYVFIQVMLIFTSSAFICGPIILDQPLPGQVDYPFQWKDSPKLISFLYFLQAIAIYQATAGVITDIEVAWLLWFTGMRFELLAEDFGNVHSSKELDECIKRHQRLIAFSSDLMIAARSFAVAVIVNSAVVNISAGYQFVSHQPFEVVLQFFLMFCVSSLEVAMIAWPADNLVTVTEQIAHAAYSTSWMNDFEMTKRIQFVIVRSQKPITVEVDGVLPGLNLNFYGKYLSTTMSYFTTLRAAIG